MEPEIVEFAASLRCRFFIRAPRQPRLAIIAMHGYGMTPEPMLRLMHAAAGPEYAILSVQGPYPFHSRPEPGEGEVVYHWGVRTQHAEAIALHHEITLKVIAAAGERLGLPPRRCILAGFSQPVGLNYRFAASYPEAAGGVIGLCGGVPRDWEDGPQYAAVSAPILHISREQDPYFPVGTASGFAARLKVRAGDVEFHMLPGGHRFPSKAAPIVQPWLARVAAAREATMRFP